MSQNEFVVKLIRLSENWEKKVFHPKNELASKFCELVGKPYLTIEQANIVISMGLDVPIEYE